MPVVFVAQLFLPHTVHFNVDHNGPPLSEQSRSPSQVFNGNYTPRRASLDGLDGSPLTPLGTAGHNTPSVVEHGAAADDAAADGLNSRHEDFFLPDPKHGSTGPHGAGGKPARPPLVTNISSLGANEPHSPVWGRTSYFNQPRSRAVDPPPQSILKQADRSPERAAPGLDGGSEMRDPEPRRVRPGDSREDSRERALCEADWSIQPAEQGNNGLRNAVNAAVKSGAADHFTWVGTVGMATDSLGDERKRDIAEKLENDNHCLAVFPSDSDFDGHYTHFSKSILWPVFHYQIPDNPRSKAYQDHSWVYYVKVNELFAERLVKAWKREDVIWINDYHLLLVPAMVRKRLPDAQIGFFLHAAFPSSEVFRCLAVRKELLEGLLGANLIGFQTQEYGQHFLQTCSRLLLVEATPRGVQLEDRFVDVATFPIGVDRATLEARRREPDVTEWLAKVRAKYAGKRLIVARDKLDHIRGVRQKLLSYELFLNKYPAMRERVVLIQVATSTTEPAELAAAVSDIVTRINSAHSSLAHQPLVFLRQDIEFPVFLAMLMAADALMITSLREGMNLTSHEFVLCQDGAMENASRHGSLILSEFTGSAALFAGAEIAVNPWDYRQCAEAIRRALELTPAQKEEQWNRLHACVQQHTAKHWLDSFLSALHAAWDQHSRQHTVSIPRLHVPDLCAQYQRASRRLFLLDYEGTIAAKGGPTGVAFTSPQRTLAALQNLTDDPRNAVIVLSECRPEDLGRALHRVPGLGLVAENGCFLKPAGAAKWARAADDAAAQAWMDGITGTLDYYRERVEGSWIERRHCSLVFHFADAADKEAAARLAGECANHVNDACRDQAVRAVPFDGGLLIETDECDKASAAQCIWADLTRASALDGGKIGTIENEKPAEVDASNDTGRLANGSIHAAANGTMNATAKGGVNGLAHGSANDTANGTMQAMKAPPAPDFVMVIGDSREDEVLYQWANALHEEGKVRDVATVSVSSRNTAAQATLTQGVTGVLSVLQKLAALSESV